MKEFPGKKIALVGLGNHGRKIFESLKGISARTVTVDPMVPQADYSTLSEVPLSSYESVILAVPDELKYTLIGAALSSSKHVLVEKPLVFNQDGDLKKFADLAIKKNVSFRVAYSLDFEPHILALLSEYFGRQDQYGDIYSINVCYCNGTAQDVIASQWKDNNCGVLLDLGCHVINLVSKFFVDLSLDKASTFLNSIETKSYDMATIILQRPRSIINMSMSFLSWKNKFELDVYCAKGSLHASGLTKWGDAQVSTHKRVFPSGRPIINSIEFDRNEDVIAEQARWFLEESAANILLPREIDYQMDMYFRNQIMHELKK